MPRYRVLMTSFINNTIVNEGDIIDFDGTPGSSLEPVEVKKKGKPAPIAPAPDGVPPEGFEEALI